MSTPKIKPNERLADQVDKILEINSAIVQQNHMLLRSIAGPRMEVTGEIDFDKIMQAPGPIMAEKEGQADE